MFPDLVARLVIGVVSGLVSRAVDTAHQTPPQAPLPPIAQQVKEGAVAEVAKQEVEQNVDLQPKPWYRSRTLWGAAVAIIAPMITLATGLTVTSQDQILVTDVIMSLAGVVGGVVAIVGRVRATRSISVGRSS